MDLGGMCSVCPYRGSNVGKFMCRVKRVALEHVADRLVCRALLFASGSLLSCPPHFADFYNDSRPNIHQIFLPETFGPTILYQRARRLRTLTGNEAFRSSSDVNHTGLSQETLYDFLVIPWKINAFDPAILFTTLYTALVYAIFYSFFEAVPLVYQGVYAMSLLQTGAIFLTAIVAVLFTTPFYLAITHYTISRPVKAGKMPSPEQRLIPGLLGSLVVPAGMFLFAWTSSTAFHWIVPTIGFLLFMIGMPTLLQSMFAYMSVSYGRYAGSLFAMNDFARSVLAFASILWSTPLYVNLGIDKGASLIGALTVVCVFGIFGLYWFGATLRKRSRFAEYETD